jgi:hypothetical protein
MKDLLLNNKKDKWGICFTEEKSDGTWKAVKMDEIDGKYNDLLLDFKQWPTL